jgi:hypothetical protein
MPVFWNCHDLAIHLAHIIIPLSVHVLRTLKNLMLLLQQACRREIDWDDKAFKACAGGSRVVAVGSIVAVPPLAVAGLCIFGAGFSVGLFDFFAQDWKVSNVNMFMAELDERFPQFQSLHH